MDLIAKAIAGLIVCGALLLASHEGLLDTASTQDVLRAAARVTAAAAGEGR